MALKDQFRQGAAADGPGVEIASRKASGPQKARSALVGDLAERLAFGVMVADFMTNAIIDTPVGFIAVDALVEGQFDPEASGFRWLVLVEEGDDRIEPWKTNALEAWCAGKATAIAIIGQGDVRTPHLDNVRLLRRYAWPLPDAEDPWLRALFRRLDAPNTPPTSVTETVDALVGLGAEPGQARKLVLEGVATDFVGCDLSRPFDDNSLVTRLFDGWENHDDNRRDPVLNMLIARSRD